MRRRLAKLALMMLVLPLSIRAAEALADLVEADRGPTKTTRVLRQSSKLGRRLAR